MQQFKACLASAKNIIAVAGAGLSAASGIPTFRGTGGLWRKYDAISLATPEGFAANPSLVWQFYSLSERKAEPNAAHMALASFSLPSHRDKVAPNSTFTLITQNVDGLSQRALNDVITEPADERADTEQPRMLEMHGRLFDVKCTSCGHVEFDLTSPICEGLRGTDLLVEQSVLDPEISESALPRCKNCGSLARPGVVWFGEMPDYLELIDRLVDKADLCIVVGTSSEVYPAAGYARAVKENGGKVAVFNMERTKGDKNADFLFLGPCEELLVEALQGM
ncbi:NAD-dependent protein deacylase [Mycena floridula]|nr:NAD-dependent protein deacylase [Mycena floridula]